MLLAQQPAHQAFSLKFYKDRKPGEIQDHIFVLKQRYQGWPNPMFFHDF